MPRAFGRRKNALFMDAELPVQKKNVWLAKQNITRSLYASPRVAFAGAKMAVPANHCRAYSTSYIEVRPSLSAKMARPVRDCTSSLRKRVSR